MYKDALRLGELYIAIRILSVFSTGLIFVAALIFPAWFLTDVFMGLIIFIVIAFPVGVIWSICTVVNAARQARR